ncbi:MAG TPA: hypothetical protein VKN63_05765 [Afifellaceae bacterium]|nr:hypothetical protein [Afifellaceae bacterium]
MWDFSISRTFSVLAGTVPFILLRMAIYFGITLAYILATGTGAGIGYGVGQLGDDPGSFAFWGGMVGIGLVSVILYWIREYILYIVKAGHIAVMVHLLDGDPIPDGEGQIAYARKEITERFVESSALFALDQIIKGVIRALTGILNIASAILPIPGIHGLIGLINGFIRMSLTYVDEIILGYNIKTKSTNPWESSKDALILYAQNGGAMMKNAVWLTVMMWILTLFIFILMLVPAGALIYFIPGNSSAFGFGLAVLLAWSTKAAVLEPFAIAALMQAYFKAIEGQVPDPQWDARLTDASSKFSELKDKAMAYVPTNPATARDHGTAA